MTAVRNVFMALMLSVPAGAQLNAQAAPAAPATSSQAPRSASSLHAAAMTITPADVQQRVGIIAHDSMGGRDTPSPGLELTASYIARQFEGFGLRPAGDSGSFIQRFPFSSNRIDASARMIEITGGPALSLMFGSDYFVVPAAGGPVSASALFVGTAKAGVSAGDSARGRILIAALPDTIGAASWQAGLTSLLPLAMQSQAAGVIVILDPAVTAEAVTRIAGPISEQIAPFPVFGLRADAAAPLLQAAGIDPASLFTATGAAPRSLAGLSLRLNTPVTGSQVMAPNVVAVLEGSDPALRDEYVVFSAHMDHVGIGGKAADGDSIFNGADDDASGTAAIIEIAQAFAAMEKAPARSVMFLLVSGEEKGLLGSEHFAANPTVPIDRIVANINIDMIGRNNPDSVTAIGLDFTSLGETAQQIVASHAALRLAIAPDLQPEERLFERSDHFSFALRNVPAIFFTTGLHEDYHSQSDEADKIDNDKLARVARMAFLLGERVANTAARPTWNKAGLDIVRAAQAARGGQ